MLLCTWRHECWFWAYLEQVRVIDAHLMVVEAALQHTKRRDLERKRMLLHDQRRSLETLLLILSGVHGSATAPPRWSQWILACLAQPGRADEMLGDTDAEYRKMVAQLGPGRAAWWYRVYVAKLVVRLLPGMAGRLLVLHKLMHL
jgi:hypothetical protein